MDTIRGTKGVLATPTLKLTPSNNFPIMYQNFCLKKKTFHQTSGYQKSDKTITSKTVIVIRQL